MKKFSRLCALSLLILAFFLHACERTTQSGNENKKEGAEIVIQKSGALELSSEKDFPRTIYIDVRDETGNLPLTPEYLPKMLREDNFEVVDNPSEAAYILSIFLLKEGKTDPEALKSMAQAGYDSKADFSGQGHSAWLADALLVQRRVPEARRESHVRLKNISSRNAIGNSQMRVAISSPIQIEGRKAYAQTFARSLAQAIRESLVPAAPQARPSRKGK